VGVAVGDAVGVAVGDAVGVGVAVGDAVGFVVGDAVGDGDGGSTEAPVNRKGVMTSPTFALMLNSKGEDDSCLIPSPLSKERVTDSPARFA
jgi:hypothetical protein